MNNLLPILFVTVFANMLIAQDVKKVFNEEKVVFYGLDFVKAKFSLPDAKPAQIKDELFAQWNQSVFGDNGRFPKEAAFKKITVYGEPFVVEKRNATANTTDMDSKYERSLTKEEIQSEISQFTGGTRKEGLGVVLMVEYFSKKDKKGIADVVFFDIATKKVLLSKQLTGEPRGAGLNSFWAGAIQVMFDKMASTEFLAWKKEAGL